jgi:hypothetical protein
MAVRRALSKTALLVEERRLRRAFLPLLLLSAAGPATAACLSGAADPDASFAAASLATDDRNDSGNVGKSEGGIVVDAGVIDFDAAACAAQQTIPSDQDGGDECVEWKQMACGLPVEYESLSDACNLTLSQCFAICDRMMRPCHVYGDSCVNGKIVRDRPLAVECAICPGSAGRRPEGFSSGSAPADGAAHPPLGAFFAELARLEAASIDAFDRLRDELLEHGAPDDLVLAAERARQDEVSHTRVMTRLARQHGAVPARVVRGPRYRRSLAEVARENMVEGCIRETFGALIAAWQASHSRDREIARALDRIARDELRHAALSWAISKWSDSVLSSEERATIVQARDEAIEGLLEEAERPLHPVLMDVAGVPSPVEQKRMLRGMLESLWAA